MLETFMEQAEKGKDIWEEIDSKFDSEQYILFPHVNDEYNFYALLYLDQFLMSKHLDKAVILCKDEVIKTVLPLFTKKEITVQIMAEDDIEAMLRYYGLFEFTTRLTIISLTKPYDTCGENLLGIKNVTKEDLLCYDIYRFDFVPRVEAPVYTDNKREIMDFLRLGINAYMKDLTDKNNLLDKTTRISLQKDCYISMLRWMTNKNRGRLLKDYFNKCPYKKVAIYGADELGRLVYHELREAKCEVACFVSKSAEGISWCADAEVIMEKDLQGNDSLDAIIVTPIHDYVEICERLNMKGVNIPTISLRDVIFEL